ARTSRTCPARTIGPIAERSSYQCTPSTLVCTQAKAWPPDVLDHQLARRAVVVAERDRVAVRRDRRLVLSDHHQVVGDEVVHGTSSATRAASRRGPFPS